MKRKALRIVAMIMSGLALMAASGYAQTVTLQTHLPSPIPNQNPGNLPWETLTLCGNDGIPTAIVNHVVVSGETPTAEIPIQRVNTPTTVEIPRVSFSVTVEIPRVVVPKRPWYCRLLPF